MIQVGLKTDYRKHFWFHQSDQGDVLDQMLPGAEFAKV
jgi:hypothetical protein